MISKRYLAILMVLALMAFTAVAFAQNDTTTTPSNDATTTTPSDETTSNMPPAPVTPAPPSNETLSTPPSTSMESITPSTNQANISGLNSVDSESFQRSLVSSCLGVPQSSVIFWRDRGYSYGQIGVAANIANRASVPVDDVLKRFEQGQSINDVASAYNLNVADATTFEPSTMAMAMAPEIRTFSDQFITRYWGINNSDLSRWHAQGFTNDQIAMAANLAARSGRSTQDVLNMVSQGMTWNQIASNLNVPVADLSIPVARPVSVAEANLMRSLLARDFGLTGSQLDQLQARGFSFEEIALIGNLAVRSGRSPIAIADMASSGMAWTDIASNIGVSSTMASVPVNRGFLFTRPVGAGTAAGRRLPRTGK